MKQTANALCYDTHVYADDVTVHSSNLWHTSVFEDNLHSVGGVG